MTATVLKMAAAQDEQVIDSPKVGFEDFWRAYPRRVAKKDALKAWQKISAEHHGRIMQAIEANKRSEQWKKDGGQFIPYPATWLNGERWEDEIDTDLTMGQCMWNINGNREVGKGRCDAAGVTEINRTIYCREHASRLGK